MNVTLLIDADSLVYQVACGLQQEINWGDVTTQSANLDQALQFVDSSIREISTTFDDAPVILALSDPTANWRMDILPSYKQNRKDFVRPILWSEIREHLEVNYKTFVRPTLEGDDVCGILATSQKIIRGDKIICGVDKDLNTVPGRHFNTRTKEHRLVTEEEADWAHLYQTLVGDPVDNYKGCPYVGPVKAKKILACHIDHWWSRVVEAFQSKGLTEADALQQAQVARICRAEDYDFNFKKVIPWHPSSH